MTKCVEMSFTKGEMNKQLASFLGSLLENKVVEGILVPQKQEKGAVMQSLITDAKLLENIDPFAPVVPVNSAKLASSLTASPAGKTIALVMRSCEIRAMVELCKLNQANFDNVLMVGIDCYGRYESTDYRKLVAGGLTTESFIEQAAAGNTAQGDVQVASACGICEFPAASHSDLRFGLLGASGSVIIESMTEKGDAALEASGQATQETPSAREAAIEKLAAQRAEARDAAFAEYQENNASFDALDERLADCVNCYNCRVACPVCYCKECVFVTDTFRHKSEQFLNWANNTGSLKMPTDTNFYHLTRMSHISTMCVGCGQCTSACPNGIELMPVFRTAADKAQKRFEYEAGRSLDEDQPLAIFESDELVEVTGQVK